MIGMFKEIWKRANVIENDIGIDADAVLNKITQELWEFNDAVQKYRWIYCKTKTYSTEKIEEELWDLLLNIVSLCTRIGIDPDIFPKLLETTLKKFEERKEIYKENMS